MTARGAELELDVRGDRAVLIGVGGREADPHAWAVGDELADALHEWARVSAAVTATDTDGGSSAVQGVDGADVVARRGRQLAGRVAEVLGVAVTYRDPVTGRALVVPPPGEGSPRPAVAAPPRSAPAQETPRAPAWSGPAAWRARAEREPGPTPWGTGLLVAGFFAAVMIVAMLALAGALASATHGLVAVAAALAVTAGLAPSLWLGRHVPVVRWIVGGTAAGIAVSWVGVVVIAV